MMQYERMALGRQAKELGFVRDTFEKMCRLSDVLRFIEQDELLTSCLALKGGTAINLTIFNLPRLSVDIDLDFSLDLPREEMLAKRQLVSGRIEKFMEANGYSLSGKSKTYHALDSAVFEYQNAAGMKDNLKIEINYMLRCHVLPTVRSTVNLPWLESDMTVLSVALLEIFASKIVALMNRTAPRDLFDLHNMLFFGLFDESEQEMLRKCVVFYSAIGSDTVPTAFSYENIMQLPQYRIKTDLLPVLRNGKYFDVQAAQKECIQYLDGLMCITQHEKDFLAAFRDKQYRPELLFSDADILKRIEHHPMAIWKCSEHARSSVLQQLREYEGTQPHTRKPKARDDMER